MSTIKRTRLAAPVPKAEPTSARRTSKATAAAASPAPAARGWAPTKPVGAGTPFVTPDIPADDAPAAKKIVGAGSPFVTPDIPPDDK